SKLDQENVFPAPAGINRHRFRPPGRTTRVPRASGDKPGALDAMMDITWSSPAPAVELPAPIFQPIKTPSPTLSPEVALSA
ncbi:TPA: hypothetical protein ACOM1O_000903, partial [Escherichia coli]